MIVAMDVEYREPQANVALVTFKSWTDEAPSQEFRRVVSPVAPYVPGAFYQRELPCLLAGLELVTDPFEVLVVDSHVWLDAQKKPGLGAHLFRALDEKYPVVGIAKRSFGPPHPEVAELLRGESENPLYISSVGIPLSKAAAYIKKMHGPFRIPTLLKRVDQLSRSWE